MSGDDHGAGLDLDAVTKVMREHRGTVPDPEKSSNEWVSWMCQCGGSIRGGHDRHIAREILAALDAEPSDAP